MWAERLKGGLPANWQQRKERPTLWAIDEREHVLEALSALPDTLKVDSVKGIYRARQSQIDPSNPASGQEGVIMLYDEAFYA